MPPSRCWAGNDLTDDISPVEAALAWAIGKRRREKFDFLGGAVRAPLLCPTPLRPTPPPRHRPSSIRPSLGTNA